MFCLVNPYSCKNYSLLSEVPSKYLILVDLFKIDLLQFFTFIHFDATYIPLTLIFIQFTLMTFLTIDWISVVLMFITFVWGRWIARDLPSTIVPYGNAYLHPAGRWLCGFSVSMYTLSYDHNTDKVSGCESEPYTRLTYEPDSAARNQFTRGKRIPKHATRARSIWSVNNKLPKRHCTTYVILTHTGNYSF